MPVTTPEYALTEEVLTEVAKRYQRAWQALRTSAPKWADYVYPLEAQASHLLACALDAEASKRDSEHRAILEVEYWQPLSGKETGSKSQKYGRADLWRPQRDEPHNHELFVEVKLARVDAPGNRIGNQSAIKILNSFADDLWRLAACAPRTKADSRDSTEPVECGLLVVVFGSSDREKPAPWGNAQTCTAALPYVPPTSADALWTEAVKQANGPKDDPKDDPYERIAELMCSAAKQMNGKLVYGKVAPSDEAPPPNCVQCVAVSWRQKRALPRVSSDAQK